MVDAAGRVHCHRGHQGAAVGGTPGRGGWCISSRETVTADCPRCGRAHPYGSGAAAHRAGSEDESRLRDRSAPPFACPSCGSLHVDGQNRSPSHLSRTPGVTRGGGRQALIATDVGARSYEEWEDWVAEERDDLPEAVSLADALSDLPPRLSFG